MRPMRDKAFLMLNYARTRLRPMGCVSYCRPRNFVRKRLDFPVKEVNTAFPRFVLLHDGYINIYFGAVWGQFLKKYTK